MYRIRRFFRRIHNLYRWFPIIWKDQDWDTHYIWEILKFKLSNQADYISFHDRYTRAQHDAKMMRLCVKLINKIQDEYYEMEYMDFEDTKFEFKPSDRCEDCNELEIVTVRDNLNDYFKKYPLIHKKVLKEKEIESKRGLALNIGYINHKRARKLLFNILENNIESWWD
jgi:hypothetical protein